MSKLRIGPSNYVTKSSRGAENEKLNFYATCYSSNYGKEGFVARTGKCKGTGYLANFRTGVYYAPSLDEYDNIAVGHMLRDNYVSSYAKHNRLYCGSDGRDELPIRAIRNSSGFTTGLPVSNPTSKTVQNVRALTVEDDLRHKPYLHRLQTKRVPHLDSGSMNLATEISKCYKGEPNVRMNTHLKNVGVMQPSGFTHYHHEDPIQYLPKAPYGGEISDRRTEITLHQTTFLPWSTMTGSEMNSGICQRAQRNNGYTNETARPRYVKRVPADAFTHVNEVPPLVAEKVAKGNPCEFVNMTKGPKKSTLTQAWYRGKQSSTIGVTDVSPNGRKEKSGFSTNNKFYLENQPTNHNFVTHYDRKFNYPHKIENYHNAGEIAKRSNGFTSGTVVHVFGDRKRFNERQIESYNPLVASIIKKEHPCYIDRTRNPKLRQRVEVQ